MVNVASWSVWEQREFVTGMQVKAAENTKTVGAFREDFRRMMEPVLSHNMVDRSVYQERMDVITDAADGIQDLKLADTEGNVLGWNTIGGGRAGVHLSRDMVGLMEAPEDAFTVQHTAAHELAHGEQVALRGTLIVNEDPVDVLEILEGHAEMVANEAMGVSIRQHRKGQPDEVYGEGQEIVVGLLQTVQRSQLEKVLTKTGNLDDLTVMLQPDSGPHVAETPYAVSA